MEKTEKNLIENSGILTHLKAIECLRKNDWAVNISPYYYDNVADLVKEIDIVAEKQFNSADYNRHSSVQVNVQLFIECKYINREIIFWFDHLNKDKAIEKLEENTGLQIADKRSSDILPSEFHYLKNEKVAKLFSTNSNNEDLVYKAVSQSLRAQVYYEQWFANPVTFQFNDHQEAKHQIVRYPVVVCDNFSNLKEVEVDQKTSKFSTKMLSDSFLLETNYVYFNKDKTATINDHFLIDFINLDSMESFLQNLEKEVHSIVRSLSIIQQMAASRQ